MMFLLSPLRRSRKTRARIYADTAQTMPTGSDPAIHETHGGAHSGHLRERPERPRPPNLPRQVNDRVRIAELTPVVSEHAQLRQQLPLGKSKLLAHTRILQRGNAESARLEQGTQPPGDGHAEAAIAIKENPTGARFASLAVCHFCNERNHRR